MTQATGSGCQWSIGEFATADGVTLRWAALVEEGLAHVKAGSCRARGLGGGGPGAAVWGYGAGV